MLKGFVVLLGVGMVAEGIILTGADAQTVWGGALTVCGIFTVVFGGLHDI